MTRPRSGPEDAFGSDATRGVTQTRDGTLEGVR
jgi:hypothetical protein